MRTSALMILEDNPKKEFYKSRYESSGFFHSQIIALYLCTMATLLTEQERHNLAMNIVGKDLESQGFEFLGVNSQLKRNPQFVALKDKKLHFVIVRAVQYPDDPNTYDPIFMQEIKEHAAKFNASTFYAGVGLGSGSDYGKPVEKDSAYTQIYNGLQEIL